MIPRILTGVALTGMLAAAGCGGGSGAGSPPLSSAPTIGGSVPAIGGAVPSAKARGSFAASFLIPYSAARASAATSRSPQYLSPGTTGLTILIGNGTTANVTGATSTTGNLAVQVSTPVAGAGQVSLAAGGTAPIAGDTLTIPGITLAANNAGGSDVFTITSVTGTGPYVLTGTWAAAGFGTAPVATAGSAVTTATTFAQAAVIGSTTAALALAPGTTTKSIPASVNGATATSSVTSSFAPSSTLGYYLFTATFSNFTAGITEYIGVVTTDLANHNFVLSEGSTTAALPATGGQVVPSVTLTLSPVVANIYVPTPTPITSLPAFVDSVGLPNTGIQTAVALPLGSLETTVFATDEMGYVIPSTGGTAENAPTFTIAAGTTTDLTLVKYISTTHSLGTGDAAVASPAVTNTSLTAVPATGQTSLVHAPLTGLVISPVVAVTSDYQLVAGAFLTNILTPTAPYTLATNGATLNGDGTIHGVATNSAGNPLAIKCGSSSSSVAWSAAFTSTVPTVTPPSGLSGYPLTVGTNYPAATKTLTLAPVNCSPGFTVPIN
jgi:hypothetical protein